MATNMDVLVLERFVLRKAVQTNGAAVDADAYLGEFTLD